MRETKATPVRTYTPKPGDVEKNWYVIDATDVVLGRLASHVATLLRGKHKATFAPHVDTGDFVVVINASAVQATGRKLDQKLYHRHSGYVGHLKSTSLRDVLEKNPEMPIKHAVKGMLPKNILGRQLLKKLKVYPGSEHPHAAQKPEQLSL